MHVASSWPRDSLPLVLISYWCTTLSIRILAEVPVLVAHIGNTLAHLVNKSVSTSMYWYSLEDVCSGPIMFQESFSKELTSFDLSQWCCKGRLWGLCLWYCREELNVLLVSWPIETCCYIFSSLWKWWSLWSWSCSNTMTSMLSGITNCIIVAKFEDWGNYW